MRDGYIKSLDGVRAVAIVLVMTFHFGLNGFGWMGVQLFFVLSGFLITGILWKEKFRPQPLAQKFKTFWVRRSLRIFPLYFGYLLVLALTYLAFQFPVYFPTYFPYLFTYTFNFTRTLADWQGNPLFTHLWSLCIEEQFYLLFPLLIFLCPPRWIRAVMIGVVLAAPGIRFLLGAYYQGLALAPEAVADAVYWNTLSHLDAFFMGGLVPVLNLPEKIRRPQRLLVATLVLAVGAGLLNFTGKARPALDYFGDLGYFHGQAGHYEYVWHYTCLNLLFAAFILTLVSAHSRQRLPRLRRLLESSVAVRIGKVSYGMYLFHWAVLVYFYARFFPATQLWARLLLFVPYLFLVYGVAELSFRLYESRFLKLKDKRFSKKEQGALPVEDSVSM